MTAFERAIFDGADGIEFDVQLARDDVPVVIHDANLKRTGRTQGSIARLSSTELSRIDVGTWFNLRFPTRACAEYDAATVPTLENVFELFQDSRALLYVEMKCSVSESRALANEVAELVKKYSLYEQVIVESFTLKAIQEIKRIDGNIRTAALFEPRLSRPLPSKRNLVEEALRYQADEIALHRSLATRYAIEIAKQNGLKMVVWTTDHLSWIRRAERDGIHALITNDPARMCAERERLSALQANSKSETCRL